MDARDLSEKLLKYWAAIYPKHSGEMPKGYTKIKVLVYTDEGYREVRVVTIKDETTLELHLDKE
jgi:hypothetical protein